MAARIKPGPGHNGPPNEDRETFLSAVRMADALAEERSNVNAKIGRFRKELKTRGYKLGVFDAVLAMRDLDREEVTAELKHRVELMRFLELPIGSQADLFPAEARKARATSAAFAAGYQAGVSGRAKVVPEEIAASKRDKEQWLDGYAEGKRAVGKDAFAKIDFTMDREDPDDGEAAGPSGEDAAEKPAKPKAKTKAKTKRADDLAPGDQIDIEQAI